MGTAMLPLMSPLFPTSAAAVSPKHVLNLGSQGKVQRFSLIHKTWPLSAPPPQPLPLLADQGRPMSCLQRPLLATFFPPALHLWLLSFPFPASGKQSPVRLPLAQDHIRALHLCHPALNSGRRERESILCGLCTRNVKTRGQSHSLFATQISFSKFLPYNKNSHYLGRNVLLKL